MYLIFYVHLKEINFADDSLSISQLMQESNVISAFYNLKIKRGII